MPIQLIEANEGRILTVRVSGKLLKEDYERFVPEFDRLIRQHGKLRVRFDMADFHGWSVSAAWQDLKLGLAHFSDIERLALVGENKWQQGMAAFCRPFTKAKVRYFARAEAAAAEAWIAESGTTAAPGEVSPAAHGH